MTFSAINQIIFVYFKKRKRKEVIEHLPARQCYYCGSFSSRKEPCSCMTGIAYKPNNQKIESFQKNYHLMGDLPFIVYFDFEMTTGDSVFHEQKIYFTSYYQVYAFHPKLKLPKILVFSSFQQNFDQITSLHHQSQEHIHIPSNYHVSNERHCHEGPLQRKHSSFD